MEPTIIALFLEEHDRISSLLNDFKKHKYDKSKKTKEIFKQISESLNRHFEEEELLYSKYKYKTGEILPILQTIRKEHSIILDGLDNISNSLKKGDKVNTMGLFLLLEKHKNIEDRLLYPELDRVLSDKEKEDVYWKIKVK